MTDWRSDRQQAARDVLATLHGEDVFEGVPMRWESGGFVSQLLSAMVKADAVNLALLGIGFPALVWAVNAYKNTEFGVESLREMAKAVSADA